MSSANCATMSNSMPDRADLTRGPASSGPGDVLKQAAPGARFRARIDATS